MVFSNSGFVARRREGAGRQVTLGRPLATIIAGIAAAAVVGALLAVTRAVAADATRNGELVSDGAWCWFQDPRAVHYVGAHDRTYVGYVNAHGDIDIVSQDAGTARLLHSTMHAGLQVDDHAAPGIAVLPDRRIIAFYSKHGGMDMFYRISVNPEDITAFGPEMSVPTKVGPLGYTYGNPVYLSAEHRLYLFFRGGDNLPQMTWTTDYVHWAGAVDMVTPRAGSTAFTRPYVKYASNGVDTVALTFTDGHPDEQTAAGAPTSLYAVTYHAGVLSAPDGTPLTVLDPTTAGSVSGLPVGPLRVDYLLAHPGNGAIVYADPGNVPSWLGAMALAANGAPIVVYSTYQNQADARYRYARWTGTGWTDIAITDAGGPIEPNDPSYSGGLDIDRNNPDVVYLSRETTPGSKLWEIDRWASTSPATITHITSNPTTKNIRPVVPWGPPGEVKVLWMSGTYDAWFYGYHTQLRELTSGRAPTTARISAAPTTIAARSAVKVSGRVVAGYLGDPVGGVTVNLLGHTAGKPDYRVRVGTTDRSGLVTFTVYPADTMRFTVQAPQSTAWGYAMSPSVLVYVGKPAAVRISTSASAIRRGQSVVVGMRAVDGRTGAVIPRASIELWQVVSGQAWQRDGRYTATLAGLVQVRRWPTVSVTYQARLAASGSYLPASSATVLVRVS